MSKAKKKSRGKKRKRPVLRPDWKAILTSGPPRTVPDPDPKRSEGGR